MKINAELMLASAGAAEEMLKGLANRHRLMILCQLIDGERSVGELAGLLALRNSTASQHLALLRKDGLVSTRREGQKIWYAIASLPARKLIETLYTYYCGPAAASAPTKPKSQKAKRAR